MHQQAFDWLRRVKPLVGARPWVCELGSYNVNGSVRELWQREATLYIGVDVRPGPGVDVVADAGQWSLGEKLLFDLVLSTECLEHAPYPGAVCDNAFRLLKPGGVFLLTAAGRQRGVHSVDGHADLAEGEHYGNIHEADLRHWLRDFAVVLIQDRDGIDIYALAIKGD